jgi:hypothetical protein
VAVAKQVTTEEVEAGGHRRSVVVVPIMAEATSPAMATAPTATEEEEAAAGRDRSTVEGLRGRHAGGITRTITVDRSIGSTVLQWAIPTWTLTMDQQGIDRWVLHQWAMTSMHRTT